MSSRTLIIAEAGVNHNGLLDLALDLVDIAADAGADIIKFQTFEPTMLASQSAPQAEYQVQNTGIRESGLAMLERLKLAREAHRPIADRCAKHGIEFLSTPFDAPSMQFLVADIGIRRIKLGSGELTNAPLLLAAAETGLPLILSTGMATLDEVQQALGVLAYGMGERREPPCRRSFIDALDKDGGGQLLRGRVTLLHCSTEYPADVAGVNLAAMATMARSFALPVGYSDHTQGIEVSLAAVAQGAVVIEKHFTLDRSLVGPDHAASLEPDELLQLVEGIRAVEAARGTGEKVPTTAELKNRSVVRKSLVAARPIKAGERFSNENIAIKRPGTGRSPFDYWDILGTVAQRAYALDELIQ